MTIKKDAFGVLKYIITNNRMGSFASLRISICPFDPNCAPCVTGAKA